MSPPPTSLPQLLRPHAPFYGQLESALAERSERQWKNQSSPESESELSEARQSASVRQRPPRSTKLVGRPPPKASRNRSGTGSTARSAEGRRSDAGDATPGNPRKPSISSGGRTPTPTSASVAGEIPDEHEHETEPEPSLPASSHATGTLRKIASGVSLSATRPASPAALTPSTPALTPALTGTTDDSDTDFQSAYSASPRESYGDFDEDGAVGALPHVDDFGVPAAAGRYQRAKNRERVSSVATTITGDRAQPSPTLSEDTIVSRARASASTVVDV